MGNHARFFVFDFITMMKAFVDLAFRWVFAET